MTLRSFSKRRRSCTSRVSAKSSWFFEFENRTKDILLALAEQGGAIHPPEHLIEAVWPGEALLPASGRNRLYVAVRELRVAGLGDLLASRDGGYVLDAPVRLLSTSRTGHPAITSSRSRSAISAAADRDRSESLAASSARFSWLKSFERW